MRNLLFVLAYLSVPLSASANEFYEGIFVIDQNPTILDPIRVIIERPRERISRATEKAVARFIRELEKPTMRLKAVSWWEGDSTRMGYDERLNTAIQGGPERLFPAKLAERLRRIDLGFANVYPNDSGPTVNVGGRARLRLRWYHGGPAVALTMPWPMRH